MGAAVTPEQHALALREREWAQTELGKLFWQFVNALGTAWATDSRERATKASMDRDWGRADAARAALLKAIRGW